jgi:beta-lactamase regulating signal transducer with metallopeptidase domain
MPVNGSDLLAGLERLSPFVAAWLLTYAVHSTLLLGIVWLACTPARLRSNALKDLLWKAAVIGGIVTPTLSVASGGASFIGRIDVPGPVTLASSGALPASTTGAPTVIDSGSSGDTGGIGGARGSGGSLAGARFSGGQDVGATSTLSDQSPQPVQGTQQVVGFLQSAGTLLASRWSDILVALWLLCTAVAAARAFSGRRRLEGYLGKRRVVRDGPLVEEIARLCSSAGIRQRIRVTCSLTLSSPVSLGRAEICLPERVATDLSREQQRCILAHELAHLVRHDPIRLSALAILQVPLFFQPLNRLAHRRMQETAEYLCDDWAVRQTGSSLSLARCLLEVATWVAASPQPSPVSGLALGASPSPLVQRVQRLLDAHVPVRAEKVRPAWLLAMFAVPLLVSYMAPAVAVLPPAAPTTPAQAQTLGGPQAPAVADLGGASTRFIDVKSEGDVLFTPNRDDVLSISPGGLFMIEQYDGIANRRVEIVPLAGGTLMHMYYVSMKARPYDAAAHAWLAQAMSQLVLQTGSGSSPFPDLSALPALPDVNKPAHASYAASVLDLQSPTGNRHIEARAQGDVSFTGDLKSITGLSFGGSFVIEEQQGAVTRKLQAMPSAGNSVVFSYLINGHPQPSNAAQDWLAAMLPTLAPALQCHVNPLALPPLEAQ